MLQEFKAFIARGNVLDLAVGFIMGAAFTGSGSSKRHPVANRRPGTDLPLIQACTLPAVETVMARRPGAARRNKIAMRSLGGERID